ncbi:hypothetical protein, partial [Streptomyces aureus]|uniref:hypothetical protein n=1 Tax=Streptomyces aureus TaxID=193461 RepID=UPI0031DAA50A
MTVLSCWELYRLRKYHNLTVRQALGRQVVSASLTSSSPMTGERSRETVFPTVRHGPGEGRRP